MEECLCAKVVGDEDNIHQVAGFAQETLKVGGLDRLDAVDGGIEEIRLGGQPATLDNLPARLKALVDRDPARPIAMQADRDAAFGLVVKVLDALKEAGVKNIPAFTEPAGEPGSSR